MATSVVITADTTQAQRAMLSLGQSVDGATRNFLNLGGVAGQFAGMLTLGAVTAYGKSIINLQDDLASLGKVYGLSAREMSGLKFAAEQNSTSLDDVARATKNLATNMAAAPEKFAKLGITAKDSVGALAQVADLVAKMPDGMQKAALLTELFGSKVGPQLSEFLSQGGDSMRAFIARGKEIYSVTDENAAKAKEFNDQLNELKARSTGLGVALVSNVLPGLNDTAEAMNRLTSEGHGVLAMWRGLAGMGKVPYDLLMPPDNLKEQLSYAGQLKEQQEKVASLQRQVNGGWGETKTARLKQELAQAEQILATMVRHQKELDNKPAATPKPEIPKSAQDLLNGLNSGRDNNASAVASLQEEAFRKEMDTLGVSAAQVKVYELAKKGATQAQIEAAQAAADEIMAVEKATQATKEQTKAEEEAKRILADIDPLERARQEYEKLLDLKNRGLLTDEQVGIAYANAMEKVAAENKKTTAAMSENWKTFADNTQRTLADVFYNGFDNVDKMFGDMLKRMAANAAAANLSNAMFGTNGKSGSESNGWIGAVLNWMFNANGNAFGSSGVVPFANGGAFGDGMILNHPTPFLFANGGTFGMGVAGEAGYEGALPLKRMSNGKLGVYADGGSPGGLTIVFHDNSSTQIDARSDRAQAMSEMNQLVDAKQARLVEMLRRERAIA